MRNTIFVAILLMLAPVAVVAKKSTLIVKTDTACALSINGKSLGTLQVDLPRNLQMPVGKQQISCTHDSRRVERTETLKSGGTVTVQLVLPPPERFEIIPEGIRDNAQKLIWNKADNGSNIGWTGAKQHCVAMGAGWKLPSGENLLSLFDANSANEFTLDFNGTPYLLKPATALIKFSGGGYWSDEVNEYGVWGVNLATGTRYTFTFDAVNFTRAICVRPD